MRLKIQYFIFGFIIIASMLSLGAGCVVNSLFFDSLASKALSAYPENFSEAQILKELYADLDKIAKKEPDTKVLAYIFLKERITPEIFESFIQGYALKGGNQCSIQVFSSAFDDRMLAWDMPIAIISAKSLREYLEPIFETLPPKTPDSPPVKYDMNKLEIASFQVWGTTSNLLHIWNENQKIIRGIGILGQEGKTEGYGLFWTKPILPQDPLR